MTTYYLNDLKVMNGVNTQKYTLNLSATGDLEYVYGREKLVLQLIRAIVNDDVIGMNILNMRSISNRAIKALITQVLRSFRQTQIEEVKKIDPDFSGFSVYRKSSGTNERFVKVSDVLVEWKFVDTELENGIEYDYAITKTFSKVFETAFLEQFTMFPSSLTSKQEISIGQNYAAIAGNRQITFYFDCNRKFRKAELLEKVISIDTQQDTTEPRKYLVNIKIQDLEGNPLDISARRNYATK